MKKIFKEIFFPILFLLILLGLIFIANNEKKDSGNLEELSYRVKVLEITDKKIINNSEETVDVDIYTYFTAKILDKENEGKIINCYQYNQDDGISINDEIVSVNDEVYVSRQEDETSYHIFERYSRVKGLFIIFILLLILIIFFGKFKGIKTAIALIYTMLIIFYAFLPGILNQQNILLWLFILVIYIIASTLLILNGISKKSLTAIISCITCTSIISLISFMVINIFKISGVTNDYSPYLKIYNPFINLQLTLVSGIIIGSIGAIMDVAVELSASLYELYLKARDNSFKSLIKSGFAIGRDMIGTMSNTLILACIGCEMNTWLLLLYTTNSITYVFSSEGISVSILQMIIGSMGVLLAIPLTTFICAFLYTKKTKKKS